MYSGGAGDGGGGNQAGWGSYLRAATQYATSTNPPTDGAQPRERGTRRKKIAGYLQAANEIRQSYTAGYTNRTAENTGEEWPRMGTARTDDEELVLFPSYARLRQPDEHNSPSPPRSDDIQEEWEVDRRKDYDAIIEVDVRGWLFAPHIGPMSRKNRYALWVARQLCGLPAQVSESPEATDNPSPEEAESARKTASAIANSSADPNLLPPPEMAQSDGSSISGIRKTGSWRSTAADNTTQQPTMSPAEINAAHAAFNSRLAPFTHRPIANVPVSVLFYNEDTSQSRSLVTSDNGHFALRVELDFIPTHVRVIASPALSAAEEVFIQPPEGVSLISDIDDTVKHSAISMGTREVFRNTFTAPLSSLIIPGVGKWYKRLASSPYGVSVHYISNSPWQLYPVLRSFFEETGLPPGSFHLKQYSGMLQGIFEPAAEKKKGTVERVIADFPHRQWILVGDSGEADLEVYTEIAERWPRKVLAICIRDVTTTLSTAETMPNEFFNNNEKLDSDRASTRSARVVVPPPPPTRTTTRDSTNLMDGELDDLSYPTVSPVPPPRPMPQATPQRHESPYPLSSSAASTASTLSLNKAPSTVATPPPPPPPKPKTLRGPPIPSKPTSLRQGSPEMSRTPSTQEPLYDGHEYSQTIETPPPLPRRTFSNMSVVNAQTKPRPPQRMATTASATAPPGVDPAVSKKEEFWRRRWESAQARLDARGVPLLSWRVGSDVEEITVRMVEKALKISNTKGTWRQDS